MAALTAGAARMVTMSRRSCNAMYALVEAASRAPTGAAATAGAADSSPTIATAIPSNRRIVNRLLSPWLRSVPIPRA